MFNTGTAEFSVVTVDAFENGLGDTAYAEDGSYTINIPEANPFFPYEVQFTYEGETTEEWFMTPDDSVEVGGHTFYVSAYIDNTEITQMSLNVAGEKVIVYPEKKEFTNDGNGAMAISLLPLEERSLYVDLTGYTPVELTRVSVDKIFGGTEEIEDTKEIVWEAYNVDEEYQINMASDQLDFSQQTYYGGTTWEMLVGEADQLAASNIRYRVTVDVTESEQWLIPTVYTKDSEENYMPVSLLDYEYSDYYRADRELWISVDETNCLDYREYYVSLQVNSELYDNVQLDQIKAYLGSFADATEISSDTTEITEELFGNNGFPVYYSENITFVAYDSEGNVTGCLPFYLHLARYDDSVEATFNSDYVSDFEYYVKNNVHYTTAILYKGYSASENWNANLHFYHGVYSSPELVIGAYVGHYNSIEEAKSAGAEDIKNGKSVIEYSADYSQGVNFTLFAQTEGTEVPKAYKICVKTVEGDVEKEEDDIAHFLYMHFSGIKNASGDIIPCYTDLSSDDSYAEGKYQTLLVGPDADLTNLAPIFSVPQRVKVYATGGTGAPEVSGESYHDFSNGAVEYTVTDEKGTNSVNYWLQVVKAEKGAGKLYINSLADKESETKIEDNIIYSKREVILSNNVDKHDIYLANIGTEAIPQISAEIESDTLELDPYWTLKGVHDLSGYTSTESPEGVYYGELANMAMVRLIPKDDIEECTEVTGTLTIKSGDKELMVLTLTGIIGSPYIVTDEIPDAVKYVPYGIMIQNNNKYHKNRVTYRLEGGNLPEGMELKPTGEIYGVPKETGTFEFAVCMENSIKKFGSSSAEFILTVKENTDTNVEAATDSNYKLLERVQDITPLNMNLSTQTLRSQGEYAEFVDVFLDGEKLVEGTDYNSSEGSTRIVIQTQTLTQGKSEGIHTIGIEFRTKDTDELRRAAQNYRINHDNSGSDSGSNGGHNSGSSGNNHSSSENDKNVTASNTQGSNVSNNIVPTGPSVVTYTVESGDSLWKIAQKYYGSGDAWKRIFDANTDKISDPNRIYVGQQLTIYITEGNLITTDQGTTYVVQSGDSLWKISRKVYGVGWFWKKIYNANKDKISDPHYLYVGQVLTIP